MSQTKTVFWHTPSHKEFTTILHLNCSINVTQTESKHLKFLGAGQTYSSQSRNYHMFWGHQHTVQKLWLLKYVHIYLKIFWGHQGAYRHTVDSPWFRWTVRSHDSSQNGFCLNHNMHKVVITLPYGIRNLDLSFMNEIKNTSFPRKLNFPEPEGNFIFRVICFCKFPWHLWFVESVDDTTPSSCFMSMTSHEGSVKMLSWLVLRYCPAFWLDELRKKMRSSVADSRIWIEGLVMKMEQGYQVIMIMTFLGWIVWFKIIFFWKHEHRYSGTRMPLLSTHYGYENMI